MIELVLAKRTEAAHSGGVGSDSQTGQLPSNLWSPNIIYDGLTHTIACPHCFVNGTLGPVYYFLEVLHVAISDISVSRILTSCRLCPRKIILVVRTTGSLKTWLTKNDRHVTKLLTPTLNNSIVFFH